MYSQRDRQIIIGALFIVIALALLVVSVAYGEGQVKFNEIGWGGTTASSTDEWFELKSTGLVDLTGWTLELVKTDGVTSTITIPPIQMYGVALFERTDDTTISTVEANGIYVGSLPNTEVFEVRLLDANGVVQDTIVNPDGEWLAGSASPRASMQLVEGVWYTSNTGVELDAGGNVVLGTPGSENQLPSQDPITCDPEGLPSNMTQELDFSGSQTDGEWLLPTVEVRGDLWAVDGTTLIETGGRAFLTFELVGTQGWTWTVTSNEYDSPEPSEDCKDAWENYVHDIGLLMNGEQTDERVGNSDETDMRRWAEAVEEFITHCFEVFMPGVMS